jgi:hypothetical protein
MSESKLTNRKRTIAFLLKNGKRGFAVEYYPAPYHEGYVRFVDCAVWPENQPDRLEELSILEVPAYLVQRVEADGTVVLGDKGEEEEAGGEVEDGGKARGRRRRSE